jgi:hypothetical protein
MPQSSRYGCTAVYNTADVYHLTDIGLEGFVIGVLEPAGCDFDQALNKDRFAVLIPRYPKGTPTPDPR